MKHRNNRRERGSAMICALVFGVACSGLAISMMRQSYALRQETAAKWNATQRLYVAKAGISDAFVNIRAGGTGAMGNADQQRSWSSGSYYVAVATNADGTKTLTSRGKVGSDSKIVRAVIRDVAKPVFDHSLYAGNSSGDANYAMRFGGTGSQADNITGDIYSGRNIVATGAPIFTGTLRAAGTITGTTGTTGIVQPGPTLASMNYAVNNNVNVASLFSGVTTKTSSSSYGGKAYQLPQTNLAHIFRKNPDDRQTEINGTSKDDYFLEDPYQTANTSSITDAAHATPIALNTGSTTGNNLVYYIDGNVWIHNKNNYSFKFMHTDTAGVHITFVIKGNLYVSDNIILQNPTKDGVAFITLKDPAVTDSGNIYFGDPVYGTLEEMDAFMYAENNFYDNNLDATGAKHIVVKGTMSAGNQVAINRDYGNSHTRMDLTFDGRIKAGTLVLPGLPPLLGSSTVQHDYRVATSWGGTQ